MCAGSEELQSDRSGESRQLMDDSREKVKTSAQLVDTWIRVNDPSAGSPTER